MDSEPTAKPVEVVAGCPACGAVYQEAERIGVARLSIHTDCPRCATPADPKPDPVSDSPGCRPGAEKP